MQSFSNLILGGIEASISIAWLGDPLSAPRTSFRPYFVGIGKRNICIGSRQHNQWPSQPLYVYQQHHLWSHQHHHQKDVRGNRGKHKVTSTPSLGNSGRICATKVYDSSLRIHITLYSKFVTHYTEAIFDGNERIAAYQVSNRSLPYLYRKSNLKEKPRVSMS